MFSENYSVCLNQDDRCVIARSGPVVTYKAIGCDNGRVVRRSPSRLPVLMKWNASDSKKMRGRRKSWITLISPQFLMSESSTITSFSYPNILKVKRRTPGVRAHGPMPADAVLRIGLQVMNLLAEAATDSLTHRSIQPANLMILPGGRRSMAAGPGLNCLISVWAASSCIRTRVRRTSCALTQREFSSLSNWENKPVDFFFLGAAMWFLLTGSAPSALATTESGPRLSASVGAVPRSVRNLVSRMVRSNPGSPQDPAAFAEKIHACLQKAERQTAFTRSFAPAAIPTIPIREENASVPLLLSPRRLRFLLRSAHSIS